ncbi:MAG: SUMF1/EgtB/PvdO family nonheme iron enzyme [Bryobacteraceae bacterium]|nr:SUMF1/EgtB/PvdO family nonheme iron enzyme [Bryobacteraceae bacterium]
MWAFLLLLAADPEFIRVDSGTLRLDDAAVRVGTFLISRTEVTQAEYRRVLSQTPALTAGADRPVERVTWFDATRYANRRSALEGLRPCYDALSRRVANCNGYRLPTGAEWTLAATPAEVTSAHLRAGGHQDIAELQGTTRPVAAGRPNARGIHDLAGNVWEWCEDWYSPEPLLDSLRDPQGPATGVARLIRGGSFLSSRGAWNKGFVSSQAPDRASPFTGFRVVRQVAPAAVLPPPDAAWLSEFALPATPQSIPPVDPAQVPALRRAWSDTLGLLPSAASVPTAKPVRHLRESTWNGTLLDLEVEPGWPARVLLMEPVRKPAGRLPVVIVPYYDVDSPAGANLGGRRAGGGVRAFARLAVERGCLAVAIRWFGEGDGEGYDEAVWQLARRHPGLTGLGKVVYDTRRLIDYLVTRPDVDARRIGIIGHSLGGKMALYAAAFEPRLSVVVASEPGIGLNLSNYEAFWYLGRRRPDQRDQQELLALIAPRPFLLIAGESSDGQKSAAFLRAAQPAYAAAGNPAHLGMLNHRQGHSPTPASVAVAMDWLERFLF